MIIVYVKHYLNGEGISFFDTKWFPKVNAIIKTQKGFKSIETHKDTNDSSCVHITVKFENQATLDAWVATKEHGEVINQLDEYRTQSWNWVITDDEQANPDSLNWNEVPLASTQQCN